MSRARTLFLLLVACVLSLTTAGAYGRTDASSTRAQPRWLSVEVHMGRGAVERLLVPLDAGGTRTIVEARADGHSTSAGAELRPSGSVSLSVWQTRVDEGETVVLFKLIAEVPADPAPRTIAEHTTPEGATRTVVVRAF